MTNSRWKIAQAAEIRWWKNYLRKKNKATYLEDKQKYWQRVLKKLEIKLQANEVVLDAGCGPAGIFLILQQQKVDAIDPLLDQYEQQLDLFDKTDYLWVNFECLALEKLQAKATYDKVFCLNVINHVADIDRCLDNLVAATKPGGDLLLAIDTHNFRWAKWLFQLIPGDILHPHQYDLQEYQQMLTRRGGEVQKLLRWKKGFLFDFWFMLVKIK